MNFTSSRLDRTSEGTRGPTPTLHPEGVSRCLTRELGYHDLNDVWRHCHPGVREYTYSREFVSEGMTVKTSSRIDRIFSFSAMMEGMSSEILYEAFGTSDHFPVKATFSLASSCATPAAGVDESASRNTW